MIGGGILHHKFGFQYDSHNKTNLQMVQVGFKIANFSLRENYRGDLVKNKCIDFRHDWVYKL